MAKMYIRDDRNDNTEMFKTLSPLEVFVFHNKYYMVIHPINGTGSCKVYNAISLDCGECTHFVDEEWVEPVSACLSIDDK